MTSTWQQITITATDIQVNGVVSNQTTPAPELIANSNAQALAWQKLFANGTEVLFGLPPDYSTFSPSDSVQTFLVVNSVISTGTGVDNGLELFLDAVYTGPDLAGSYLFLVSRQSIPDPNSGSSVPAILRIASPTGIITANLLDNLTNR